MYCIIYCFKHVPVKANKDYYCNGPHKQIVADHNLRLLLLLSSLKHLFAMLIRCKELNYNGISDRYWMLENKQI